MTKIRLILCIVLLTALAAIPCYAQKWDVINSAGTTCTIGKCVYLDLPANTASVSVVVSGTFVATLQFEVSADGGTNWTSASPASTTTEGTFTFSVAGKNRVQVRASAFTSGAAKISIATSTVSIGGSDLPDPGADGACLVSSSGAWARGECSGTPATDPTPSLTEDPTNVISSKPLKIGAGGYVFNGSTNAAGVIHDDGSGNMTSSKVALADMATGTLSGTGSKVGTVTGTLTQNKQLAFDANGNIVASATDIGAGGAGGGSSLLEIVPQAANVTGDSTDKTLLATSGTYTLAAGKCVRVTFAGSWTAGAATAKVFKLLLGTTAFAYGSTSSTVSNGQNVFVTGTVCNNAGVQNAQTALLSPIINGAATLAGAMVPTGAADMSVAKTIGIALNAGADHTITPKMMIVEVIQ